MTKASQTILAFILGAALGAVSIHFFPPRRSAVPTSWIELGTEGSGLSFASDALFNVDIPLPDVDKPHGQAKFLD